MSKQNNATTTPIDDEMNSRVNRITTDRGIEDITTMDLSQTAWPTSPPIKMFNSIEPSISCRILTLDLSGNALTRIINVRNLINLQTLRLANNSIVNIENLWALTQLRFLDLSGNSIEYIPVEISANAELKTVNLKNNKLQSFSSIKSMSLLPKIETCELSGNPICKTVTYRDMIMNAMPSLAVLDGVIVLRTPREKETPRKTLKHNSMGDMARFGIGLDKADTPNKQDPSKKVTSPDDTPPTVLSPTPTKRELTAKQKSTNQIHKVVKDLPRLSKFGGPRTEGNKSTSSEYIVEKPSRTPLLSHVKTTSDVKDIQKDLELCSKDSITERTALLGAIHETLNKLLSQTSEILNTNSQMAVKLGELSNSCNCDGAELTSDLVKMNEAQAQAIHQSFEHLYSMMNQIPRSTSNTESTTVTPANGHGRRDHSGDFMLSHMQSNSNGRFRKQPKRYVDHLAKEVYISLLDTQNPSSISERIMTEPDDVKTSSRIVTNLLSSAITATKKVSGELQSKLTTNFKVVSPSSTSTSKKTPAMNKSDRPTIDVQQVPNSAGLSGGGNLSAKLNKSSMDASGGNWRK